MSEHHQPQGQGDAIANRGITAANQTDPATEQTQFGDGCPGISNEDEEKLFRPE